MGSGLSDTTHLMKEAPAHALTGHWSLVTGHWSLVTGHGSGIALSGALLGLPSSIGGGVEVSA